jgi:hypothetical protein
MKQFVLGLLILMVAAACKPAEAEVKPEIGRPVERITSPAVESRSNVFYDLTLKSDGTVEGIAVNRTEFKDFILLQLCGYDKDDIRMLTVPVQFRDVAPGKRLKFSLSVEPVVKRIEVCTAFSQAFDH